MRAPSSLLHTPLRLGVCALLLAPCALLLTACTTVRLDHARRLMERPDFAAARAAAPEWCRDALKTINQLEYQLEAK
ncbi:MAG: hypothetical protein PHE83_05810 [Opitutaceae bacterium]|nr:hypothetical protein [Opitutaceae bacterium]